MRIWIWDWRRGMGLGPLLVLLSLSWQQLTVQSTAPTVPERLSRLLATVAPSPASFCNASTQGAILSLLHQAANGANWIHNSGWTEPPGSVNCTTVAANGTVLKLPDHCCFYGISCCTAAVCPVRGPASYNCNCTFGLLTNVTLDYNNVTGTLDVVGAPILALSLACSLRVMSLINNSLTGSIPPTLSVFTDLRVLGLGYNNITGKIPPEMGSFYGLVEFDVKRNRLTGTVPSGLCGTSIRRSTVTDIAIGGNQLTGVLSLVNCDALIYLDATDNKFDGPMLDTSAFSQLHILRLPNNNIMGTVADNFALTRRLSIFDLANNSLAGTIPNNFNTLPYLVQVALSNNKLTGQLPATLFELGTVSSVDLSSNLLTGCLPSPSCDGRPTPIHTAALSLFQSSQALTSLDLSNNTLIGTIPDELGAFAKLTVSVNLVLNLLSCCGKGFSENGTAGYLEVDESMPRLPSFLAFSSFYVPQTSDTGADFSFITCPAFHIRGQKDTIDNLLHWYMDPQYFLFQGCKCVPGYVATMSTKYVAYQGQTYSMGPSMSCAPKPQPWYTARPWLIVVIVLGCVTGLPLAGWLLSQQRSGGRPLSQLLANLRKRVAGEPAGGLVSVVTTDIEGYSDLFKQSPELMTRALNIHNSIIRKARWNNYGYTLEQEGDSYSLVFYEAFDAVSFCLQTQQALQKVDWPLGLFPEASASNSAKKSRQGLHARIFSSISTISSLVKSARPGGSPTGSMRGGGDTVDVTPAASFTAPHVRGAMDAASLAAVAEQRAMAESMLFNGLRVRMGCATGELSSIRAAQGRCVTDMAKVVSDAGAGGQVLMDTPTFLAVKERLEELGAVDHNGLNASKLNARRPAWYRCSSKKKRKSSTSDATVLDMGEYLYCPTRQAPAIPEEPLVPPTPGPHSMHHGRSQRHSHSGFDPATLGAPPSTSSPASATAYISHLHSGSPLLTGTAAKPGLPLLATAGAMAAGVGVPGGPVGPPPAGGDEEDMQRLRLYQVLPPSLASRAKVFGNKLSLKSEWQCVDAPYFAAPGAWQAPIGVFDGPIQLPLVTMVFSTVDGGKRLGSREARAVHRIVASVVSNTIRCFAGGYSCRAQAAELKYMTVFADAQAALSWCLVMQEALLYADWPETVLRCDRCREETDADGRLLFRGARLKMGVCEGRPKSIIPDHLGRVDYHGASINQAARFMDAGAHGGQVVCEDVLSMNYLQAARGSTNSNSQRLPTSFTGAVGLSGLPAPQQSRFQHPSQHPGIAAAIASNAAAAASAASTLATSNSMFEVGASGHSKVLQAVVEDDGDEDEGVRDRGARSSNGRSGGSDTGSGTDGSFRRAPGSLSIFARQPGDGDPSHQQPPPSHHHLGPPTALILNVGPSSDEGASSAPILPTLGGIPYIRDLSFRSEPGDGPVGSDRERDSHLRSVSGDIDFPSRFSNDLPRVSFRRSDTGEMAVAGQLTSPCASEPSPRGMRKMKLNIVTQLAMEDAPLRTRSYTGPTPEKSNATPRPKRRPILELKPMRLMIVGQSDGKDDGLSPASSIIIIDDTLGPPPREHRTQVHAVRTGIFRFKGSPDDIAMVQVVTAAVAGRRYPAEPPKGKGDRVAESIGLVMSGDVALPGIVLDYKEKYEARLAAEGLLSTPGPAEGAMQPSELPSAATGRFGSDLLRRVRSQSAAAVMQPPPPPPPLPPLLPPLGGEAGSPSRFMPAGTASLTRVVFAAGAAAAPTPSSSGAPSPQQEPGRWTTNPAAEGAENGGVSEGMLNGWAVGSEDLASSGRIAPNGSGGGSSGGGDGNGSRFGSGGGGNGSGGSGGGGGVAAFSGVIFGSPQAGARKSIGSLQLSSASGAPPARREPDYRV